MNLVIDPKRYKAQSLVTLNWQTFWLVGWLVIRKLPNRNQRLEEHTNCNPRFGHLIMQNFDCPIECRLESVEDAESTPAKRAFQNELLMIAL